MTRSRRQHAAASRSRPATATGCERWSPEENERVFGRLTVPHGHNYTLDVTVRGPIDPRDRAWSSTSAS